MKIAVATQNEGKLKEFNELAALTPYDFIKLPSSINQLPAETGKTFYENALIKAKFVSDTLGIPAIGDDSGLEVDALDGRPGIYSARYSDTGTDQDNCLKLLKELEECKDKTRNARFKCSLVGYFQGKIISSSGSLEGNIATQFKGSNGFGYDPIFVVESGYHLAELKKSEKNEISHRSSAFLKLLKEIPMLFN